MLLLENYYRFFHLGRVPGNYVAFDVSVLPAFRQMGATLLLYPGAAPR